MQKPNSGAIYNVCDDEPAAAADVTSFAYNLLSVPLPSAIFFEEAEASMSEMGKSFWRDNRRVKNDKIKNLDPKQAKKEFDRYKKKEAPITAKIKDIDAEIKALDKTLEEAKETEREMRY